MRENQERRQARRQQRGRDRVDEILTVAGSLFATTGYDRVTTNTIAAEAGISPGSLYQFFPNKEVIAQAYATAATTQLHHVYDAVLAPAVVGLPLPAFLDTFVDALIAFNREHPGYLALAIASTISPPLAAALADLHAGIETRLDALLQARWPSLPPAQRRVRGLVSYRLFLGVLPLVLDTEAPDTDAIVRETKRMLARAWADEQGD